MIVYSASSCAVCGRVKTEGGMAAGAVWVVGEDMDAIVFVDVVVVDGEGEGEGSRFRAWTLQALTGETAERRAHDRYLRLALGPPSSPSPIQFNHSISRSLMPANDVVSLLQDLRTCESICRTMLCQELYAEDNAADNDAKKQISAAVTRQRFKTRPLLTRRL